MVYGGFDFDYPPCGELRGAGILVRLTATTHAQHSDAEEAKNLNEFYVINQKVKGKSQVKSALLTT